MRLDRELGKHFILIGEFHAIYAGFQAVWFGESPPYMTMSDKLNSSWPLFVQSVVSMSVIGFCSLTKILVISLSIH